jgi:hypothetical protein
MENIEFDKKKLKALKEAYALAMEQEDKEAIFIFEGKELLPAYAKYMIEYLEGKL